MKLVKQQPSAAYAAHNARDRIIWPKPRPKIVRTARPNSASNRTISIFYEKLKVPPPTFCPSCRLSRRFNWINLTALYRRKCDLCKKESISMYAPDAPYVVYCAPCWWSDKWDPFEYGQDYDFFAPVLRTVRRAHAQSPASGPCHRIERFGNIALHELRWFAQELLLVVPFRIRRDSANGFYILHSNKILDSALVLECEKLYDSMHNYKVSNGVGLRQQVVESMNCGFLRDCFNCQFCFASANLRNKKYVFKNRQLTKGGLRKGTGEDRSRFLRDL